MTGSLKHNKNRKKREFVANNKLSTKNGNFYELKACLLIVYTVQSAKFLKMYCIL